MRPPDDPRRGGESGGPEGASGLLAHPHGPRLPPGAPPSPTPPPIPATPKCGSRRTAENRAPRVCTFPTSTWIGTPGEVSGLLTHQRLGGVWHRAVPSREVTPPTGPPEYGEEGGEGRHPPGGGSAPSAACLSPSHAGGGSGGVMDTGEPMPGDQRLLPDGVSPPGGWDCAQDDAMGSEGPPRDSQPFFFG